MPKFDDGNNDPKPLSARASARVLMTAGAGIAPDHALHLGVRRQRTAAGRLTGTAERDRREDLGGERAQRLELRLTG